MRRARCTVITTAGLALGCGVVLGSIPAARADSDVSACRASSEVRPAHAFPGQQLLYSARIVRREDVQKVEWERPLSFPGFRAEWLPGRAEDTRMQYRGISFLAREEHRALFAARAGEFRIPPAVLRCTVAGRGPHPPSVEHVEVPGVTVRVEAVPKLQRPEQWSGLIGPVHALAVAEPLSLSLGGAVRLSVQVRGTGNLWVIDPPLGPRSKSKSKSEPGAMMDGAEIFAHPLELALDEGERLGVRRFFRYDIVPRQTGALTIPALRFAYFDPITHRFAEERTEAIEIAVTPRAEHIPEASVAPKAARRGGRAGPDRRALAAVAFGLAIVAALVASGFWLWRRRGVDPWRQVDRALDAAAAEASRGDPMAEARELALALCSALAAGSPGPADCDPSALRRAADAQSGTPAGARLRELAAQLEALAWVRFSGDLGHPDRDAARRLVRDLRDAR